MPKCRKCDSIKLAAKGLCRKHYMQGYRTRVGAKEYEKKMFDNWLSKGDNKEKYLVKKKELRQTPAYKERVNEYRRNKYNTDDNFRLSCIVRSHLNRVIGGSLSEVNYSVEELKSHLESQFTEGMTWDNHGKWHIDHIKPLASFNLTNEKDRSVAYGIDNLQPLWAKENLSKGASNA